LNIDRFANHGLAPREGTKMSKQKKQDPKQADALTVSGTGLLATIAGLGLIAAALAIGIWMGGGSASRQTAAPSSNAGVAEAPSAQEAPVQQAAAQQAPSNPAAMGGVDAPSDPEAASESEPATEPETATEPEPEAKPVVIENAYIPTGAATDAEGLTAAEEGRIGQPTLVFFHADWCHVCQEIAPEMTEIQTEYAETVAFVKMNVDHAESTSARQRYGVRGTPTFVMFDARGRKIQQFSGWPGRQQMTGLMDSVVALQ
jgi:thiol-disulfide isomerase/thioredoxin